MKAVTRVIVAAVSSVSLLAGAASAQTSPLVWYDAQRQAVAVNPHAEGWFRPPIDVDFDSEHASGATIHRTDWNDQLGLSAAPGVFDTRTLYCPASGWSSTLTLYGWGARLGSLAPVTGYLSDVTQLSFVPVIAATDRIEYFTDVWDVARALTVVYLRPLDSANHPVPVTPGALANVWFRVGSDPWTRLQVAPAAAPPPVAAAMEISPRTLNLSSKGQWVTVRLLLPEGHPAESVDVDSLRLALQTEQRGSGGDAQQSVRHSSGPLAVSREGGGLMVKFNRLELRGILFPGEAALTLSGRFLDGTRFEATGALTVIQ